MSEVSPKRRVWGWYFYDFASQPYHTLLITFIFAPYVTEALGDGSAAQAAWGYGVGIAGLIIALLAPVLGAIADRAGGRIRFIWAFSVLYVVGAWGLWLATPDDFNLPLILCFFGLGLIGMEFATIFTNAMMPSLGDHDKLGNISGSGWAFGYVGGVLALAIMLVFFAESATTGKTFIGLSPILGLDPEMREGTRAVGPFTAIWFAVFMIPFFLWVKEGPAENRQPIRVAVRGALPELAQTLRHLPQNRSLFAYLGSSMFYRDALNGMYIFGGIYASGVLEWTVIDVGVFGILAAISGAIFAKIGGIADQKFGPKPVIVANVLTLTCVAIAIVFVSRDMVFGIAVEATSNLPDIVFYILGAMIGAAGGALQSASRTMMVRQADPRRTTEAFGLFALAGKATSFVAPLTIGFVTDLSGNQQLGITPLIALFLIGLFLLLWVKPNGEKFEQWSAPSSPFV